MENDTIHKRLSQIEGNIEEMNKLMDEVGTNSLDAEILVKEEMVNSESLDSGSGETGEALNVEGLDNSGEEEKGNVADLTDLRSKEVSEMEVRGPIDGLNGIPSNAVAVTIEEHLNGTDADDLNTPGEAVAGLELREPNAVTDTSKLADENSREKFTTAAEDTIEPASMLQNSGSKSISSKPAEAEVLNNQPIEITSRKIDESSEQLGGHESAIVSEVVEEHTPKAAQLEEGEWEDLEDANKRMNEAEDQSDVETDHVEASPDTSLDSEVNEGIYVAKKVERVAKAQADKEDEFKPVKNVRVSTNPFRVLSVSSNNSRVSSAGRQFDSAPSSPPMDHSAQLQKKLDRLTYKCSKLQKEIAYLSDMNHMGTLPIDDAKKLNRAIEKLQDYLDKKNKEKYEIGVLLSRQLRREIDRGEKGQFWVGTK